MPALARVLVALLALALAYGLGVLTAQYAVALGQGLRVALGGSAAT